METKELLRTIQKRLLAPPAKSQHLPQVNCRTLVEIQGKAKLAGQISKGLLDQLLFWLVDYGFDADGIIVDHLVNQWRVMNPDDHIQVSEFNRIIEAIRNHTFPQPINVDSEGSQNDPANELSFDVENGNSSKREVAK